MKRLQKLTPWLAGILAAILLFAALAAFFGFRYENSDDALLVKAFMGFEGESASFTLYTHTLLAWALHTLSVAVPNVAWFSLFQLALLWFSCVVIFKSLMQTARAHGLCMAWGALAGAVYIGVFAAFACCRVTYTTTAALAGAAAVVQLLSIDHQGYSKAAICRGFALSALLLVACYSLRQIALLPPLAFWLLALLWQLWRCYGFGKRRSMKPLLVCVCAFAVVLGGLVAVREVELDARGQRDFIKWYNTRCSLYDYLPFEQDSEPAARANSGLSEAELALMRQWYLMDANVTTERLALLRDAYAEVRADTAFTNLGGFLSGGATGKRYVVSLALCGLLLLLCLGGKLPDRLAALLCALGGAALIFYLAYQGRVIFRSVDCALFPCAGMLLCLTLAALGGQQPRGLRRALALALCLCCVAVSGYDVLLTKKALSAAPDSVSQQREAELEAYALQNPDTLLVRTPNLLRDTRLFPDVSAGMPDNIIIWGDWYCRTPTWVAQLGRFGFDAERFAAPSWLSDRIAFVTVDDAPPEELTTYVAEGAGKNVQATLTDEYGTLRVFKLQAE